MSSFFSFFLPFSFPLCFKGGTCFCHHPRMVWCPTALLSSLLQPAQRGHSRPARAQGSARRARPTAAPPPRPRRSARAATATTGQTSTRRQLPVPVSNRSGFAGVCRVSLPSAAGEATWIKPQSMRVFLSYFLAPSCSGGSVTAAGWTSGKPAKVKPPQGWFSFAEGRAPRIEHPSLSASRAVEVLVALAQISSSSHWKKQRALRLPLFCFPGTLLWHAPKAE